MEQKVEFVVPVPNSNIYRHRVGEMGANANGEDGGDKMLSIRIDKTICFIIFFNSKVVHRYEDPYEEYIWLLKLRIYLLISFHFTPN